MAIERYRFTTCALIWDTQANFGLLHPEARTPINLGRGVIAPTALHAWAALHSTSARYQAAILEAHSGFEVRQFLRTRKPDHKGWETLQLDAMKWVLRVKACQHWSRIAGQLAGACNFPLVFRTERDQFFGCTAAGLELVGENRLGKLWGEIFAEMQAGLLRPGLGPVLPKPFFIGLC